MDIEKFDLLFSVNHPIGGFSDASGTKGAKVVFLAQKK